MTQSVAELNLLFLLEVICEGQDCPGRKAEWRGRSVHTKRGMVCTVRLMCGPCRQKVQQYVAWQLLYAGGVKCHIHQLRVDMQWEKL